MHLKVSDLSFELYSEVIYHISILLLKINGDLCLFIFTFFVYLRFQLELQVFK